jgi:hypothetical protein
MRHGVTAPVGLEADPEGLVAPVQAISRATAMYWQAAAAQI